MTGVEERPYQLRAIEEARAAFRRGKQAVLLVAPTGAGKTTIAACIIQAAVAKGRRVCFLAHRDELIDQACARFRKFGLRVGARGDDAGARVQVTSPQTILARGQAPEADLVVPDESHHYVAKRWGEITAAYRKAGANVVGITATPERPDGIGLGELFDHLVVVAQIGELTDGGYLVPCETAAPKAGVKALAMAPVDAYERWGEGRSTVVFAPHVKAAYEFAEAFRERGIGVGVVEGEVTKDERRATLDAFASGRIRVVVNVMVLTEGWDCPRAKVCILARKIGSATLYIQMVGRVLRPENVRAAPGERARMIDLSGNFALHGDVAEPRIWSLTGAACSRWGQQPGDGIRKCRVCRTEIPVELELDACPECGTPVPEQKTPSPEDIELELIAAREAKAKARASMPVDKRVKMLAGLYVKALGPKGGGKKQAEVIYQRMTKRWPDTELMVAAWRLATEKIAATKGDAWEPPRAAE